MTINILLDQLRHPVVGDHVLFDRITPGVVLEQDRNYLVKLLKDSNPPPVLAKPEDITPMFYYPDRNMHVGDVVRYIGYCPLDSHPCRDYVVISTLIADTLQYRCKNIESGKEQIFCRDVLALLSQVENQLEIEAPSGASTPRFSICNAVPCVPKMFDDFH